MHSASFTNDLQTEAMIRLVESSLASKCEPRLATQDSHGNSITMTPDLPPRVIGKCLWCGLHPASETLQNIQRGSGVTWEIPQTTTQSDLHVDATAQLTVGNEHLHYLNRFSHESSALAAAAANPGLWICVRTSLDSKFRYKWRNGRVLSGQVEFVGRELRVNLCAA